MISKAQFGALTPAAFGGVSLTDSFFQQYDTEFAGGHYSVAIVGAARLWFGENTGRNPVMAEVRRLSTQAFHELVAKHEQLRAFMGGISPSSFQIGSNCGSTEEAFVSSWSSLMQPQPTGDSINQLRPLFSVWWDAFVLIDESKHSRTARGSIAGGLPAGNYLAAGARDGLFSTLRFRDSKVDRVVVTDLSRVMANQDFSEFAETHEIEPHPTSSKVEMVSGGIRVGLEILGPQRLDRNDVIECVGLDLAELP